MSAPPYMKLYVADYLGDTHHLSAIEHGAYMLLLMGMWRAGGTLPAADANLSRLARCTPAEWETVKAAILPFFKRSRGKLTHKRIASEMAKYETVSRHRSEAGKAGAAKKALKDSELAEANAVVLPTKPEPEPEPKKIDEPTVHCRPKADALPVQEAFDEWNATATRRRLPIAKSLTPVRRRQIKARLADGGIVGWREALRAVEASPLCLGENDRGWRADLDFVCQPKSFAKLREGSYAAPVKAGQSPPRDGAIRIDPALQALHESLLNGTAANA